MSETAEVRRFEPPSLQGSARVLMLSTMVMAAAAAAVLALGTQDAHLLRLGVVAALWAALLAAFATARARREVSSRAEHADQLRAVYQLELQREVVARREHALTVERALREQAQLSQHREIGQLRADLAAIGGNRSAAPVAKGPAPTSPPAITASPDPRSRFGPGRPGPSASDVQGRHGPSRGRSGGGAPAAPGQAPKALPAAQAQRTVQDLLAAHGAATSPHRRRTHEARQR
ncbi:MAG TPA: DUF6779 domain-containing protein [Pseudonocardiaceae bacterium]|jgi:hypothetical protein|nr:DUF6779 domain-containing protein [Pseudonocardiaceae bacterium]